MKKINELYKYLSDKIAEGIGDDYVTIFENETLNELTKKATKEDKTLIVVS